MVEIKYPGYVAEITGMLTDAGYKAYIVGGCVRDAMLGIQAHDFDVTTSALPEQMLEVLSSKRILLTGLKHGTVTVLNGSPVEVTTFRIDGDYRDSRHPENVYFTDDIVKDLSRRDFTVNAMAYNSSVGLVDPFGGREDIGRRLIRGVGDPGKRFEEDALRILRAFRFSAQLGFDIEEETLSAAADKREGLTRISRERVGIEFRKLLCSPYPEKPLSLIYGYGIYEYISAGWFPDEKAVNIIGKISSAPEARLGAFLHGCDTSLATEILGNLKYSNKMTSAAMLTKNGSEAARDGDAAEARRFALRYGNSAVYAAQTACALKLISPEYEKLVADTAESGTCLSLSGLAVNGKDMAALGYRGAEIGKTLSYLLEKVITEPSLNQKELLCKLAENRKEK